MSRERGNLSDWPLVGRRRKERPAPFRSRPPDWQARRARVQLVSSSSQVTRPIAFPALPFLLLYIIKAKTRSAENQQQQWRPREPKLEWPPAAGRTGEGKSWPDLKELPAVPLSLAGGLFRRARELRAPTEPVRTSGDGPTPAPPPPPGLAGALMALRARAGR